MYVKFITFISASTFLATCNVAERVENTLAANAIVGPEHIQVTLEVANMRYPENQTLLDASVAQVVFPKIVKAGLLFGGSYGEGYLVRDGIMLSQVRLAGGNAFYMRVLSPSCKLSTSLTTRHSQTSGRAGNSHCTARSITRVMDRA